MATNVREIERPVVAQEQKDWVWTDQPQDVDLSSISWVYKAKYWLEGMLGALSWYFLIAASLLAGLIITNDGGVTGISLVWSAFLILGIDATVVFTAKVAQNAREGKVGAMWLWAFLSAIPVLLTVESLVVVGIHFSEGVSIAEAFRSIWITPWVYAVQRGVAGGLLLAVAANSSPKVLWKLDRSKVVTRFGKNGDPLKKQGAAVVAEEKNAAERPLEMTPTAGRKRKGTPEQRARKAWRPGMSTKELEAAAQIGHGTAQKYRAQFEDEMEGLRRVA